MHLKICRNVLHFRNSFNFWNRTITFCTALWGTVCYFCVGLFFIPNAHCFNLWSVTYIIQITGDVRREALSWSICLFVPVLFVSYFVISLFFFLIQHLLLFAINMIVCYMYMSLCTPFLSTTVVFSHHQNSFQ